MTPGLKTSDGTDAHWPLGWLFQDALKEKEEQNCCLDEVKNQTPSKEISQLRKSPKKVAAASHSWSAPILRVLQIRQMQPAEGQSLTLGMVSS